MDQQSCCFSSLHIWSFLPSKQHTFLFLETKVRVFMWRFSWNAGGQSNLKMTAMFLSSVIWEMRFAAKTAMTTHGLSYSERKRSASTFTAHTLRRFSHRLSASNSIHHSCISEKGNDWIHEPTWERRLYTEASLSFSSFLQYLSLWYFHCGRKWLMRVQRVFKWAERLNAAWLSPGYSAVCELGWKRGSGSGRLAEWIRH